MNEGFNNLWPTTVLYGNIKDEECLSRVVTEIYTLYDITNPPSDYGDFSIFDMGSTVLEDFKNKHVLPAFDKYLKEQYNLSLDEYNAYYVKAWVAGNVPGYTMASHNHSGSHLTAVFYVMSEHTEHGGQIVLTDPRSNANRGYPNELQAQFKPQIISPKTGDYLIFPSFLYHHVTTYMSNFRVCVPVDLTLRKED